MEKFNPSYSLTEFKNSDYRITKTAQRNVEDFYKSMTSYAHHKICQDVYHVPCGNMILYVKFTQNVVSEFTLLSFKEK